MKVIRLPPLPIKSMQFPSRSEPAVTRLVPASAGVAPNKFVAKIASGWKKPNGLTVIPPDRVDAFLRELPVEALWGVGPKIAARLKAIGLSKLMDVRAVDIDKLKEVVGSWAGNLVQMANGIDERPVEPRHERKSLGTENTFREDLTDIAEMKKYIDAMAREDASWLAREKLYARTVTLKVRYANFETVTRSKTETPATRSADEIAARAVALLDRTEAVRRPVRLLGVSLHGLASEPAVSCNDIQLYLPFPSSESGHGAENALS